MNYLKKVWESIFGKKKELHWPYEFAIVTYSEPAQASNVKNDSTKIILHYSRDKIGNLKHRQFLYTAEKVYTLEQIRKIPVYDRTMMPEDKNLPVHARIFPQEARYVEK